MLETALSAISQQLPSRVGGDASRPDGSLDREAIHRKAVAFEAIYLAQMLKPMFEGLETAAPFGGGAGEEVWRSMQVQEFGQAIAENGGVGLADAVYGELLAAQEDYLRGSK